MEKTGQAPWHKRIYVGAARRVARVRSTVEGGIALTFDDGPDPAVTPAILDLLDDFGVFATFFAVGATAARYPTIVREIAARGHAIGSHSMSHRDLRSLSGAEVRNDTLESIDLLESIIQNPVVAYRPPKGRLDMVAAAALRGLPIQVWLWSATSGDWDDASTPDDIAAAAVYLASDAAQYMTGQTLHINGGMVMV